MGDNSWDDGGTTLDGSVRILPENAVEYVLFTIDARHATKPLARLEQVRKAAVQLSERLTRDHIWQKDAFSLETVSRKGLVYLYGITDYGDAVEDEWLVVYMLRELSRAFSDVWVRVCDADGEFLLVEAAKSVPRWLNPEMDAHRVWIHDGHLKIIPPEGIESGGVSEPGLSRSITLEDATRTIRSNPETLLHLPDLESEAFYRLEKYPAHIEACVHYARIVLPRKLAYILHRYPRAVAQAVEAFHYQDPILMKRLYKHGREGSFLFPPEDLVAVSVKFTQVLYAQLQTQRFKPPDSWSSQFTFYAAAKGSPGPADRGKEAAGGDGGDGSRGKVDAMINLGMKITCGFELMAAVAESSNNRTVREIGLVLEDLQEDGDGAADVLPTDDEIKSWKDVDRDDDDSWLEIGFADLERELDRDMSMGSPASKQPPESGAPEGSGFGDAHMQTDLRKIVSRFQDFLNDNEAGLEGAQFDEMDEDNDTDNDNDNDKDEDSDEEDGETSVVGDGVRFDEEKFARLMRELVDPGSTGRKAPAPAAKDKGPPESRGGDFVSSSNQHTNDKHDDAGDDDDEQGILELAAQFEKELRGYGALNLGVASEEKRHATVEDNDASGSASAGVSATHVLGTSSQAQDESMDEMEREVDVDYNLARNLLESFKGQAGMAGPAGNLLSMMGLSLPRDEDEDDEEDENEDENGDNAKHGKEQ